MRLHRRVTLPLVLAAALVASTAATDGPPTETLHLTGRVVDDASGRPLQAAQVYLPGPNLGALTNQDGRYLILVPRAALSGAEVRVVAELMGYRRQEASVPIPDPGIADTVTQDFRLQGTALALDQIVVRTNRAPAEQAATVGVPAAFPAAQARSRRDYIRPAFRPGDPPAWNREQYAHIDENPFRSVEDRPLSTFSVDVDRASYSNIRRFLLEERRLPPVDAVQVEEMVNYFSYDYARPRGDHPVAVTTEVGAAPWAPEHRLLRVGLATRPIDTEDMPPANLVFLLDVSGSMASYDKLPLVQSSMRLLVDQLRPRDRVSIVVYAGAAGLVLEPTSGRHRGRILDAIERLHAGGSTAGGAGLRLAYDVARRHFDAEGNNRVILATDGDFNVGESSDGAMVRLVEERRDQGTFLTVLGFGTGNLQSEKMQQLAQHGNGNYAYIDGLHEARKVLVSELGGTLLTVARDVKVQVEFNPARVRGYRLLGYENRLLAAEDFNDDARDAGDMGAGHTVTALYEIIPAGVESELLPPKVDPLRYQTPNRESAAGGGGELAFVKVRYKRPAGGSSRLLEHPVVETGDAVSDDFSFAAAVAGFGMLLRESEHRGFITAERVMALADDGIGTDEDGYRRGFLDLVRAYCEIEGECATYPVR